MKILPPPPQIGTHNMGFSAQFPAKERPGNWTLSRLSAASERSTLWTDASVDQNFHCLLYIKEAFAHMNFWGKQYGQSRGHFFQGRSVQTNGPESSSKLSSDCQTGNGPWMALPSACSSEFEPSMRWRNAHLHDGTIDGCVNLAGALGRHSFYFLACSRKKVAQMPDPKLSYHLQESSGPPGPKSQNKVSKKVFWRLSGPLVVESSIAVKDAVEHRGPSIAFLFRACLKGVLDTIAPLSRVCKKKFSQITQKSLKYPDLDPLGVFFGLFRYFGELFSRPPKKTLFETFVWRFQGLRAWKLLQIAPHIAT